MKKKVSVGISAAVVVLAALVVWAAAPSVGGPPPPNLSVSPSPGIDAVELVSWPENAQVRVEILRQPGGPVLFSGVTTIGPNREGGIGREEHGVNLVAGMEVTASDGITMRSLVLAANLAVTSFDLQADVVAGTGPATATSVGVIAFDGSDPDCPIDVAVVGGSWEASFGAPPCQKDLKADTQIEVVLNDGDGDVTFTRWARPECDGRPATIFGTPGADTLVGTAGADVIHGLDGGDRILGKGGGDAICGGNGRDILNGGPGKDSIFGQKGADRIVGGPGGDTITGGPKGDTIAGNGGADNINGDGGNDNIKGNRGADKINGGNGNDTIRGGAGKDTCKGGRGKDDVKGC